MKLFMVIYLAGKVAGTVGPLPYGVEDCRERAHEMLDRGNPSVRTPEGYALTDVRLECEFHIERPMTDE